MDRKRVVRLVRCDCESHHLVGTRATTILQLAASAASRSLSVVARRSVSWIVSMSRNTALSPLPEKSEPGPAFRSKKQAAYPHDDPQRETGRRHLGQASGLYGSNGGICDGTSSLYENTPQTRHRQRGHTTHHTPYTQHFLVHSGCQDRLSSSFL